MSHPRFAPLLLLLARLFFDAVAYADPFDQCQEYLKYGMPGEQGDWLCRKGFALSHDPEKKTPAWVAEHLTAEKASALIADRDDFRPDPDLPTGKRAELADYKGSGFDRGHMAPAGDMRWDTQAMRESFYLSNVSPQVGPRMNRGIWRNLEETVRAWALQRGELYIFTGPIYESGETIRYIGDNRVAVPTHFYKIIFDPVRVDAIAFIMPNTELKTEEMPNYIVTVDEVEERTDLDFLSTIDAEVQELVESRSPASLWE